MKTALAEKLPAFLKKGPNSRQIIGNLFLICLLFQVFLVSRFSPLYYLLEILFYTEVILVIWSLVKNARKEVLFLACVALIFVVRIPFYLQGNGMIITSDNALEALQPSEIQDSHTAPIFLLNSSGHNGTLKYLFTAFVWDIFGWSYLSFLLVQLVFFLGFLYLFKEIFGKIIAGRILFILMLAHFAFIEVIFDYSIFNRGGPYMEMLFFFGLGVLLFDWTLRSKPRMFLAFYFFLFSFYLHPTGIFLSLPFLAVASIYAFKSRKLPLFLGLLVMAAALSMSHLVYWELAGAKPPPSGDWYRYILISAAHLSLNQIPGYVASLGQHFQTAFQGLFNFELSFSREFFRDPKIWESILQAISQAIILLSYAVLLAGLALAVRRLLAVRKRGLGLKDAPSLLALFLFGSVLAKMFILSPKPFLEPRHNLDLAILVVLCYVLVFDVLSGWLRRAAWRPTAAILALFVFAGPHYFYFLKVAEFKKESYRQIMPVLRDNGVKFLASDFIIVYPIYFLSQRQIAVTDTLGPVTINFFYPELKAAVDRIPWDKKAYLFFSDAYYRADWHIQKTHLFQTRILDRLEKANIPYRVVKLEYYTIILPAPSRLRNTS